MLLLAVLAVSALAFARVALASPDFQVTVSPSSQQLQPGSSVSFAIGIGSIGGFSAPVTLSISGLPSGVSGQFAPNPISPSGTSILTLTAAANAATGTFAFTITATGGGTTHDATGSAKVDFGLVPICYGRASGVVTNAETGQPIAGVTGPFGSITGADGFYSYDRVPLGENNSATEWPLRASKDPPAFAHIGSYWDALGTGVYVCGQTTVVDFALVPVHPGHVSGTVFVGNPDPSDYGKVIPTSTPIEGATPAIPFLAPEQPFTTGADGHYELSFHLGLNNDPIDTAVLVDVPGLPYRHGYWQNTVGFHVSADEHVHLDIGLVKQCTASISGQAIYGDTGLPAANVNIVAGNAAITDIVPFSGQEPPIATDAQGRFSIPEILIGHNNQPVKLGVDATGPAGYVDAHDESPDAIGCGGHWDARLVLQPGPALHVGALQGHVYDTETGAPIADATVCVDFCSRGTTTDSQGFYRIDGIGVSFDSSITTRQAPVAAVHGQAPIYYGDSGTVEIVVGSTAVHDFHLLRQRYGRVTGVVRDEITHAPIAGAVSCSGGGGVADQNGGYDTGQILPLDYPNAPTSTSCRFIADGYWYKDVSTTIRADETTQLDVNLLPVCHATISGTVVDAITQLPIAGASVAGGDVSTTTGADGGYRLENVNVGYNNSPLDAGITAAAPGYFTQTKTVTVFCGGTIVLDFGRPSTGRIIVVKRTSPAGSTQGFDFTRNWGSTFSLKDGDSFDSGPITAGSGYSVRESQPLPDGWTQTGASCSDGSPATDIDVSAGETVTCTFTNQQGGQPTGTVAVSKSCPNGVARDSDRFQVTANGQAVGDPLACGGSLNVSVAAGSGYAIDEQAAGAANLGNYTKQLSAGCTGTLASGGSVRCTITNTLKSGTIVVRKQAQPAGNATKFAFTGDAAGAIGDGQSITVSNLMPGTYNSAEDVPAGWNLGSISCDDGQSATPSSGIVSTATATFHLDAGETVICTFTDFKQGAIVVKKQTQPAGAAGSFAFTGDVAGSISDGGTITTANLSTVGSPTYHATEAGPAPNFDLTSISCDDGGSANPSTGDVGSRTANFRLDPGETVTCTFTNTQRGTVAVKKTVSGSAPGGSQSFDFQLRQNASTSSDGTTLATGTATSSNADAFTFGGKFPSGDYQLCEVVMPGWKTSLVGAFVPNSVNNPLLDNSPLCVGFTLAAGEAKLFGVNNTPPPGGLARTIGFWKNWSSCANSNGKQKPVLDQTLAAAGGSLSIGSLSVNSCATAVSILSKQDVKTGQKMASDPAYSLAAQLLAAKLNGVAQAGTCAAATSAITDGQTLLLAIKFTGTGAYAKKMTSTQLNQATTLATSLDRYNNNLLC